MYEQCTLYCLDDVECLDQCWQKWREAMVRLTRDDGAQLKHAPLISHGAACTALSIDPGAEHCGVALVQCEGGGERSGGAGQVGGGVGG